MKISKLLGVGVVLAGLVSVTAGVAHADTLDNIRKAKKIRVAIDMSVPPYAMMNEQMQPVGSDVEAAQLLAADLGVELDIVRVPSPNRIPYLLSNKVDVILSQLSVTDERKKVIDFSRAYAVIEAAILAPTNMEIKGAADLVGKRVITTRGTASDKVTSEFAPGANIIRFEDDATSITAVVSGQADIFGTAPSLLGAINQKSPSRKLEKKFVMKTFDLAVGIRKGDTTLLNWTDEWVQKNLKNGKLNAINIKYQGGPLPDSMLK